MSSALEAFREAVREFYGPAWEVIDRPDGTVILSVCADEEIGRMKLDAYRSSPMFPHDALREAVDRIRALIDPRMVEWQREQDDRIRDLTDEITRLKGEVAAAKAIVADLFERAKAPSMWCSPPPEVPK